MVTNSRCNTHTNTHAAAAMLCMYENRGRLKLTPPPHTHTTSVQEALNYSFNQRGFGTFVEIDKTLAELRDLTDDIELGSAIRKYLFDFHKIPLTENSSFNDLPNTVLILHNFDIVASFCRQVLCKLISHRIRIVLTNSGGAKTKTKGEVR
jgi:hypothetical protein